MKYRVRAKNHKTRQFEILKFLVQRKRWWGWQTVWWCDSPDQAARLKTTVQSLETEQATDESETQ